MKKKKVVRKKRLTKREKETQALRYQVGSGLVELLERGDYCPQHLRHILLELVDHWENGECYEKNDQC